MQVAVALVSLIVLDAIWLGLLMSDFYRRQLAPVARMVDGRLDVVWPAAALVYPLLAGGLTLFVLRTARTSSEAALLGAAFGIVTYGVYDLTNQATLREWPVLLTAVDIAWGALLCGLTAWFVAVMVKP